VGSALSITSFERKNYDRRASRGRASEVMATDKKAVKIDFRNITFKVEMPSTGDELLDGAPKKQWKEILKGCSGTILPGQVLVIMGASGAGKTSLLNILSDRLKMDRKKQIGGTRTVNDEQELNLDVFGKIGSYVMQDDVVFEYFTVREALIFAARLKLGVSEEEQDERVDQLLKDLQLEGVQHSIVGNKQKRTLFGGDRKKVSIGLELITDPSVVMMDEPTSGLDSLMAVEIVKIMHDLAEKGKTVCTTIHQPSSKAFFYFDRLILMMDGYIVYQGTAAESPDYFRKLGETVPTQANPADTFLMMLQVNYPKQDADHVRI
jgi:ATP-binding cassette, subfamily G (WHITE), eye pigment precursor transporter